MRYIFSAVSFFSRWRRIVGLISVICIRGEQEEIACVVSTTGWLHILY